MAGAKKFTFIPNYGDPNDPQVRVKYGYLEANVSIVGNLALFVLKLVLGLFLNSIAVIADGFHSLSDVTTSVVVILGFKMSMKPPDKEHPFGHGRTEYIATLIIAVLLIVTGVTFIETAGTRIFEPSPIANAAYVPLISLIVLISAGAKELMARYSFAIGKLISSETLIADAWHHRSDMISSIGVAIGILGSMAGYPILDAIFGLVVASIIIYVGVNLARSSSNFLIGKQPDSEVVEEIRALALSIDGVTGIHRISLHDYGSSKIVTFHAEVENDLPLDDAHEIADTLERTIHEKLKYSTIVHLDPKELHMDCEVTEKIISDILEKHDDVISFHNIQIIRRGTVEDIKMHVVVDKDMKIAQSHALTHELQAIIQREYGACEVDIHLEPCDRNCEGCQVYCSKRAKEG